MADGTLKVGQITTSSGSGTITIPDAVTVSSASLSNTPAFEAFLSSAQSINDNTYTKIQFNTEVYDTNNCYDNSSNYRFTPTTAGKYFVYSYVLMDTSAGNMRQISTRIYKNGNQGGGNKLGAFELFEQDGSYIDEGEGDFNKHGNDSWSYGQRGFDFIMRDQYGYNGDLDHQIFPESSRNDFQRVMLKPAASDNYSFENGAHIRDAFIHTLSIRANMRLDERTWRPAI